MTPTVVLQPDVAFAALRRGCSDLGWHLVEESTDPKEFRGIDILRAIRSFDPCMPCTTHMHMDGRTVSREIVSCACGGDVHDHH